MTRLLASSLIASAILLADFSEMLWRYRRPLSVSNISPIAEFTVDGELYRRSAANLDDLRILRNGSEIPYLIQALAGTRQTLQTPAAIVNKGYVPNIGLQAVIDLRGHREHNRLQIVTPLRNFRESVRLETSDDAHTWSVVEPAGLIFDVSREDHAANETTVTYPGSTRRYLRVTIPGWNQPANLQSVLVAEFRETGETRDVIAAAPPVVREDTKAQTTELTVDLGFAGRPFDEIEMSVDPGYFSRTVEVETASDPQHWFTSSGGAIFRTEDEEQLRLALGERTERYLKIKVFNGDNAPLHFGAVTVSGIRRVVKFAAADPGNYFVYLGNPGSRHPSYDLERILPTTAHAIPEATLGATQPNPAFRAPQRPWTDRNPWLLNGALVSAVVAMGLITVRMMRKVNTS